MDHLRNINFLLLVSTILFGISFFLGYLSGDYIQLDNGDKNTTIPDASLNLSLKLFINNIIVCLILIGGIFLFGVPTIFLLLINGFFLGIGVKSLFLINLELGEVFIKLFPHGILEIPAFLLSASIGFLGLTFYFHPKKELLNKVKKLVIIVFLMIIFAAIIEGLITVTL